MSNREGLPIWYELMTDAPDAAQEFYGMVMGWVFSKPPGGLERDYRIFTTSDGEGVGGVMMAPQDASFAPTWAVYFGVTDVDAASEKVTVLGGGVEIQPQDIPDVGRLAFVRDPQGAFFYLMRSDSDIERTAFAPMKLGHCAWNELVTNDQQAALKFYRELFGWEKSGAMPMNEMGDYTFLKCGKTDIGPVMNAPEAGTEPFWNFAFNVVDIDAAKAAAEFGGGTITLGPIKLPTAGDWLLQVNDPQGAKVMFTGPRRRHVGN